LIVSVLPMFCDWISFSQDVSGICIRPVINPLVVDPAEKDLVIVVFQLFYRISRIISWTSRRLGNDMAFVTNDSLTVMCSGANDKLLFADNTTVSRSSPKNLSSLIRHVHGVILDAFSTSVATRRYLSGHHYNIMYSIMRITPDPSVKASHGRSSKVTEQSIVLPFSSHVDRCNISTYYIQHKLCTLY
jgi:hypothetical protein